MKVLLIEDDDDLAEVLSSALSELGLRVVRASDGEEGLYWATEWTWDVVVLDLMLPRLDGMEVLRRLRRTCSIPVLVLTARDALDDRVKGLDGGADDYVVKPVALPELVARLRALGRRSTEARPDRLRLMELTIDLRQYRLERDGVPVTLTRSEWSILEALLASPGEPLSARQLGDRLALGDEPVHVNTIAVHIRNLRCKIGERHIVTRRGFGYLIADRPENDR